MPDYVVVQAGGRGSRLRHLTWNKPKCLVSVDGRPVLYRIFDQFPGAKFIIIGDYKFEELSNYLQMEPPPCEYTLVRAEDSGTSSGIALALEQIDAKSSVAVIWSDILFDGFHINAEITERINSAEFGIVLTDNFVCRWSLVDKNVLAENPSETEGVAGIFYMKNKSVLKNLPKGGEFVKWISRNISVFQTFSFDLMKEVGDFDTIQHLNASSSHCRFFNDVVLDDSVVRKSLTDERYRSVSEDEVVWYKEVSARGFANIPRIYSYDPLVMERIHGKHLFEFEDLEITRRAKILENYVEVLSNLHALGSTIGSSEACNSVYFSKTVARAQEIETINPFARQKSFVVNGMKCKNYLHEDNLCELQKIVNSLCKVEKFSVIHGDCTFSNTILSQDNKIYLIDPRGSFHTRGIFGDPTYDFAKLYYSCYSNYDTFNRRNFKLYLDGVKGIAEVLMDDGKFKKISDSVFSLAFGNRLTEIKIINALIWASLSGYAKDDFDSAIGSYCLGIYYLNEALK